MGRIRLWSIGKDTVRFIVDKVAEAEFDAFYFGMSGTRGLQV